MSHITKEEILQMQLRNERRKQRKAQQGQPKKESLLMSALGSEPVQRFMQAPRQAMLENIQRRAEVGEAAGGISTWNPLGPLAAPKHVARELASDILDFAADIPYSPIPEEWGERMDPSRDTEIGAKVLEEKEARMRERGGEPLSWAEQYDIMAEVQDEAMPWLTKRWGPGGFVSTRGLMEAGGEVGVGLASFAVPPLAAARVGAVGGRLAGMAGRAAPAVRAATRATQEVVLIPRRIEQLADAIIGKPLGFALKWGVKEPIAATGKVSMAGLRVLTNRFKNRAVDEGLPLDLVKEKQLELAQEAVNKGVVRGMPSGHPLTPSDLMSPGDVGPVGRPSERNMFNITDIEVPSARTGGPKWYEIGADWLRASRNQALSLIPGARVITGSPALRRLGRDAANNIRHWWDVTQNKIESVTKVQVGYAEMYVDVLKRAGVVKSMRKLTEDLAGKADARPDYALADGGSWGAVNDAHSDANLTFMDDWFPKNDHNLSQADATFRGHTLKIDALGNEVVDPKLSPGFTDVIERKNLYRKQLAAIKLVMPKTGEHKTAWDLIDELSRWGHEIDLQNRSIGRIKAGGPKGIKSELGDTYFPRGGEVVGLPDSDVGLSTILKRATHHRDFISQADGMENGKVYMHPAEALRSEMRATGKSIRDKKYADFVKGFAEENGLQFGTVSELLGRSLFFRNYMEAVEYMRETVQNHLSRLTDRQKYTGDKPTPTAGPGEVGARAVVAVPEKGFRLPKDLAGAKPKWQLHPLVFESDIDRALFIVSRTKLSRADARYLNWLRTLREYEGMTDAEIRGVGQRVREHIKAAVSGKGATDQVVIRPSSVSLEVTKAKPTPTAGPGAAAARAVGDDAVEQLKAMVKPEDAPQRMYDQMVPYATTVADSLLDEQITGSTKMIRSLRKQAGSENAIAIHNMAIRIAKAEKARRAGVPIPAKPIPVSVTQQDSPGVVAAKQFLADTDGLTIEGFLAEDGTAARFMKKIEDNYFTWKGSLDEFRNALVPQGEKHAFDIRMGTVNSTGTKAAREVTADLKAWAPEFGPAPLDLGNQFFPWEYYDEVAKAFGDLAGQRVGGLGRITRPLFIVQTFFRQMGATADLSSPGIQGLVHLWYDAFRLTAGRVALRTRARLPGEVGRRAQAELTIQPQGDAFSAIKAMVNAGFRTQEGGQRVLNEAVYLFDQNAKRTGTLTSIEWARAGGALREHAVDYTLGTRSEGFMGTLARQPLLKQAERMFNFYGNQIRLNGMDRELQVLMAQTGKTAQQLLDDGSAASIASVMNSTTGVGRRGFGGDLGQFIFFAPSFFNARLRVMGQMLKGTPIERRVARKYMFTYLGEATMATIALNLAFGEETDINPFAFNEATGKWRFNANFMRVKVGQLNISLFGPWDTMLRIAALPFFLAMNQRQGIDPKQALRDLRGAISAPISNINLDLITGEDAIGRKTPTYATAFTSWPHKGKEGAPSLVEFMSEFTTPFAWQEVVYPEPGGRSLVERAGRGTGEERVEVIVQLGLQAMGGKSSYETVNESMNKAYAEIMTLGPKHPATQEAYGVTTGLMSQSQLDALYAEQGRGIIANVGGKNITLSLRHMFQDRTPPFADVARDIQKNIERMIEQGRFKDIMTPEDLEGLRNRSREMLEASARVYARYQVERDDLLDEENTTLTEIVTAFERGEEWEDVTIGNLEALLKVISTQRSNFATRRAALTKAGGPYEDVHDLFAYSTESALGNLSTADGDLYDTATALYYETVWGDKDEQGQKRKAIYNVKSGSMDWDLYEARVEEWADKMEERFPSMTPTDVLIMRHRVRGDAEEDAPPVVRDLLKARRYLVEQKWYEHLEEVKLYYAARYPKATEVIEKYQSAGDLDQEVARDENPWLANVVRAGERYRDELQKEPRVDGIVILLGKRITPASERGRQVKDILVANKTEAKKIDNWQDFISAVWKNHPLERFER